jgi:hypothetical protein
MGFHAELEGLDLHPPTRHTVVGGSAGDISALTCVKIVGIGDFFPKVEKGNGELDKIAGVIVTGITEGVTGSLFTVGRLPNVNTSQWSPGTNLFCDTCGDLTTTATTTIMKATVLEQHSASGSLFIYNTIKVGNTDISGLTDVGPITPSEGDILTYTSESTWGVTALSSVAEKFNISSIADVGAITPSSNDILVYKASASSWSATALSSVAEHFALSSVSDVVSTTPSAGDVLTWTTASTWEPQQGGGGGGGSVVLWNDACGNTPFENYQYGLKVRTFGAGLSQTLYGQVIVPASHQAGDQISLITSIFASATGSVKLAAEVEMIRMGTDAFNAAAPHQYSSTNAEITITAAEIPYRIVIPITDAVGVIDTIAFSGSDGVILQVGLHAADDSASAGIHFLQDMVEVSL